MLQILPFNRTTYICITYHSIYYIDYYIDVCTNACMHIEGDKELLRTRLQWREDLWIREFKTLYPLGLKMELNSPIYE